MFFLPLIERNSTECICGVPIVENCFIQNKITGQIEIVGNICIKNWSNKTYECNKKCFNYVNKISEDKINILRLMPEPLSDKMKKLDIITEEEEKKYNEIRENKHSVRKINNEDKYALHKDLTLDNLKYLHNINSKGRKLIEKNKPELQLLYVLKESIDTKNNDLYKKLWKEKNPRTNKYQKLIYKKSISDYKWKDKEDEKLTDICFIDSPFYFPIKTSYKDISNNYNFCKWIINEDFSDLYNLTQYLIRNGKLII